MHFKLRHKRERKAQELWKEVAKENIQLILAEHPNKQRRPRLRRLKAIDSDLMQNGFESETKGNVLDGTNDK